MVEFDKDLIYFLRNQEFLIVSTFDSKKRIHCSAKDIVDIDPCGKIYVVDLFCRNTLANLRRDSNITVTAVNNKSFSGYTIKGKASLIDKPDISKDMRGKWEERILKRISKRVISDVQKEKSTPYNPESLLPKLCSLIEIIAEEIIDLTPKNLKHKK